MKIIEAISRVDALVPNGYASGQKILWLSQLEALLEYVRGQRKGKSDNQAVRLLNALASEQAEA